MAVIKTMKKVVKKVSQDLKAMKVGKARALKKVSKMIRKKFRTKRFATLRLASASTRVLSTLGAVG